MNNYLGEETYVLMFPDGSYLAGFKDEDAAYLAAKRHYISENQYLPAAGIDVIHEGYAVGKCFVFIPEDK